MGGFNDKTGSDKILVVENWEGGREGERGEKEEKEGVRERG